MGIGTTHELKRRIFPAYNAPQIDSVKICDKALVAKTNVYRTADSHHSNCVNSPLLISDYYFELAILLFKRSSSLSLTPLPE